MIKRDIYLQKIIDRMNNGMIKVITGIRRCGKSYLLFEIFYKYLLEHGVSNSHIITLQLDDRLNIKYRNPDELCDFIHSKIIDFQKYYILLDEVQLVQNFEEVLISFLHIQNVDIYVAGSNAKFLSSDIITEFRGRGDQIYLSPLSFKAFSSLSKRAASAAFCSVKPFKSLAISGLSVSFGVGSAISISPVSLIEHKGPLRPADTIATWLPVICVS